MTPRRLLLVLFLAALAAAPFLVADYSVTVLNYVGLGALVALGLVLLTGIGGLTSFGQAAFVGIGAYVAGYGSTALALDPWLTLPLGLLVAGLVAWAIGLATLGLSGHFLPLSTIAWSIALYYAAGNAQALGGHNGITGIPPVTVAGVPLEGARAMYVLIALFLLVGMLSVRNLRNSRLGRAIRCLRARAAMAEAFGVDTAKLRRIIFVHAAVLAAASGWLYAHLLRFVNPSPFGLNASIEYLFMAVLGGVTAIWGAIVGAGVVTLIRDRLQDLMPNLFGAGGALEAVVFGVLMVVILLRARTGVIPYLARFVPQDPPPPVPTDAAPLPSRPHRAPDGPLLRVEGATKRFGGLVAVNQVSFQLMPGEILGVIGPNGAGKSTLFNLVTGVLPASEGRISFMGERIDALPSREIARRGVARTFQHVQIKTDMSVLDNVMIGAHLRGRAGAVEAILKLDRREEASMRAVAAREIARVGLADALHLPAGSLALGQQRIVEIARALAAEPTLLLLDEPAAGLRFREKQELAALLRQLKVEGLTVLLVEHDMDFVMNLVDRLVVMDFGEVIAEGGPRAIQTDPKVYEAYLGGID